MVDNETEIKTIEAVTVTSQPSDFKTYNSCDSGENGTTSNVWIKSLNSSPMDAPVWKVIETPIAFTYCEKDEGRGETILKTNGKESPEREMIIIGLSANETVGKTITTVNMEPKDVNENMDKVTKVDVISQPARRSSTSTCQERLLVDNAQSNSKYNQMDQQQFSNGQTEIIAQQSVTANRNIHYSTDGDKSIINMYTTTEKLNDEQRTENAIVTPATSKMEPWTKRIEISWRNSKEAPNLGEKASHVSDLKGLSGTTIKPTWIMRRPTQLNTKNQKLITEEIPVEVEDLSSVKHVETTPTNSLASTSSDNKFPASTGAIKRVTSLIDNWTTANAKRVAANRSSVGDYGITRYSSPTASESFKKTLELYDHLNQEEDNKAAKVTVTRRSTGFINEGQRSTNLNYAMKSNAGSEEFKNSRQSSNIYSKPTVSPNDFVEYDSGAINNLETTNQSQLESSAEYIKPGYFKKVFENYQRAIEEHKKGTQIALNQRAKTNDTTVTGKRGQFRNDANDPYATKNEGEVNVDLPYTSEERYQQAEVVQQSTSREEIEVVNRLDSDSSATNNLETKHQSHLEITADDCIKPGYFKKVFENYQRAIGADNNTGQTPFNQQKDVDFSYTRPIALVETALPSKYGSAYGLTTTDRMDIVHVQNEPLVLNEGYSSTYQAPQRGYATEDNRRAVPVDDSKLVPKSEDSSADVEEIIKPGYFKKVFEKYQRAIEEDKKGTQVLLNQRTETKDTAVTGQTEQFSKVPNNHQKATVNKMDDFLFKKDVVLIAKYDDGQPQQRRTRTNYNDAVKKGNDQEITTIFNTARTINYQNRQQFDSNGEWIAEEVKTNNEDTQKIGGIKEVWEPEKSRTDIVPEVKPSVGTLLYQPESNFEYNILPRSQLSTSVITYDERKRNVNNEKVFIGSGPTQITPDIQTDWSFPTSSPSREILESEDDELDGGLLIPADSLEIKDDIDQEAQKIEETGGGQELQEEDLAEIILKESPVVETIPYQPEDDFLSGFLSGHQLSTTVITYDDEKRNADRAKVFIGSEPPKTTSVMKPELGITCNNSSHTNTTLSQERPQPAQRGYPGDSQGMEHKQTKIITSLSMNYDELKADELVEKEPEWVTNIFRMGSIPRQRNQYSIVREGLEREYEHDRQDQK